MKPFLQQLASASYARYGTEIRQMAFVFPNRRAGLFFRKYLSQAAGRPIFAPSVLTISELFDRLSDRQPADRLELLFLLYRIYLRRSGWDESFDSFVYWGEMLLNDFDEVDKYLVDARRLFTNITDLRDLEGDLDYLTEAQVAAIRAFWSTFQPQTEDRNQREFLKIWQLLYDMYDDLRQTLSTLGKGYEGMRFREALERLRQGGVGEALPYSRIVFVGLHALSTVERELMLLLRKADLADFYWDYASEKVRDTDNRASDFVDENLRLFPSDLPLPEAITGEPKIELTGVPSRIGQAKQVHTLLSELLTDGQTLEGEDALRTAVVLPDEQLLIPVLHAIPEHIRRINVTLGYPLSGTPVASLVDAALALQKNARQTDSVTLYHHRDVLSLLNHPFIQAACGKEAQALAREIVRHNRIYVRPDDAGQTPFLSLLFPAACETEALPDYLIALLQTLDGTLQAGRPERGDEEPAGMEVLEQEFLYACFKVINRMKELTEASGIRMSVETCAGLLKRMMDGVSIPFEGEPLSGLQIMGMLETRVLDFERLIILSMNEGIFPPRRASNSFIPYSLRHGFGLPAHDYQDSIRAYHFYRLIARAKQVTLLYDTRTEGLQTGEASRFVHQLKYHYEMPLREKLAVYPVTVASPPSIQVEKTAEVMTKLSAFLEGGHRALSASAMNTWLDCPLRFYFTWIEELREEDEVVESVENDLFGSLLHRVMEGVYEPFCGVQVTADLLKRAAVESSLTPLIQQAFAELYFHSQDVRPLTGRHYLTGELIRKYALKILECDRKLTPFRYLSSERRIQCHLSLSDGKKVRLKGFIDRLDEVGGAVRMVDYKTGVRKQLEFRDTAGLFDPSDEKRQSAVMQIFLYAWMYGETEGVHSVQPAVYYLRALFDDAFDPSVYAGREKSRVTDFTAYRSEFEENLRHCLETLFHPETPFTQAAGIKTCGYCSFREICGR
ncbi:MAG: PD-(D/E)XK nuclease family protein [Tannerella sp.]|nr:PD-(D/E)XK nuclease family protein [Tannerella sp.]